MAFFQLSLLPCPLPFPLSPLRPAITHTIFTKESAEYEKGLTDGGRSSRLFFFLVSVLGEFCFVFYFMKKRLSPLGGQVERGCIVLAPRDLIMLMNERHILPKR